MIETNRLLPTLPKRKAKQSGQKRKRYTVGATYADGDAVHLDPTEIIPGHVIYRGLDLWQVP